MKILLTLLALLLSLPAAADPAPAADPAKRIEVFRLAAVAVEGRLTVEHLGYQVIVYDVDAGRRFETELNAGLPRDAQGLRAALPQRIREWGGDAAVAARIGTAWQGLLRAKSYGLDRHPAVVFDGGQAVVYGTTDVAWALTRYLAWQRGQR